MTGVKINIVTAIEIGERYAADSPQFVPMVNTTRKTFTIMEVAADAAYLSYENLDMVTEAGGIPFIAFKSNSTGAKGGTFEKMFHDQPSIPDVLRGHEQQVLNKIRQEKWSVCEIREAHQLFEWT